MCGIVGYVGRAQAAPILLDGLMKLEYRGYDSAGLAVREKQAAEIQVVKTAGRIAKLQEITAGGKNLPGTSGVGHTRWATHGAPSAENAHPHCSPERRVVLVHNGMIENYAPIRAALERRGCVFRSQTDTEAAVLLLDECYAQQANAGMPPGERAINAIGALMRRLEGSFALGILFGDQPGVLYAARRESPLIVGRCEGESGGHMLASDIPAMLGMTRRVICIDNDQIVRLTEDECTVWNIDGKAVGMPAIEIPWDAQSAEKGGYAHFMLKEIFEQPEAVRRTVSPRVTETDGRLRTDLSETGLSDADWRKIRRVLLLGCGSAYHAGLIGRQVIERLARVPCRCELASEFCCGDAPVEADTLSIVISQSGETADSLAALRLCRRLGMKTLAVVNVVGSSIAREADALLCTHAGPEIAVATTKAYAAQLAALYLVAVHLADRRAALEETQRHALLGDLLSLEKGIRSALEQRAYAARTAERIADCRDVYFIGRDLDYALCMEGSLKLKEVSYIHSEAFAAGELKHGPISLIEPGTPVIAVAMQPHLFARMRAAMAQVRARGAVVIAVTTQEEQALGDAADDVLRLPQVNPLFAASAAAIPLQLLAYDVACRRKLDVDKPRNLAKSVTVE